MKLEYQVKSSNPGGTSLVVILPARSPRFDPRLSIKTGSGTGFIAHLLLTAAVRVGEFFVYFPSVESIASSSYTCEIFDVFHNKEIPMSR